MRPASDFIYIQLSNSRNVQRSGRSAGGIGSILPVEQGRSGIYERAAAAVFSYVCAWNGSNLWFSLTKYV